MGREKLDKRGIVLQQWAGGWEVTIAQEMEEIIKRMDRGKSLWEIKSSMISKLEERAYKEKERWKKKLLKELESDIREELSKITEYGVSDGEFKILSIVHSEDNSYVRYSYLANGCGIEDSAFWGLHDYKSTFIAKILWHIRESMRIRIEYAEEYKKNIFMKGHRNLFRDIWLKIGGEHYAQNITIDLGGYLELPSEGSGDGKDYGFLLAEVPKRIQEYNENIDKVIKCFERCIQDLKDRKYKEE